MSEGVQSLIIALFSSSVLTTLIGSIVGIINTRAQLNAKKDKQIVEGIQKVVENTENIKEKVKEHSLSIEKNNTLTKEIGHKKLLEWCCKLEDKGWCSSYEFKDLTDFYTAYKSCGGNGSGTRAYERVKLLPIKEIQCGC